MSNGVYCLTSPSGKKYVGVGVTKRGDGVEQRFWCYKNLRCKEQTRLYNALKKHGPENFKYDIILETDDRDNALRSEMYLIDVWDLQNPDKGYNITCGGDKSMAGLKWSNEQRNKLYAVNRGRKHTEIAVKNMSEGQKGRILSEQHRKKISEYQSGKILSEETRKKIGDSHRGKKYNRKNVFYILDEITNEILIVRNIKMFGEENNICGYNLTRRKKVKNFILIGKTI